MNGSAARLVRGWVELYTRGMPTDVRAGRRDEIDDDLWCQHHEAAALGRSPRSLSVETLMRLLLGVPADVSWRLSHGGRRGAPAPERSTSVGTRVIGALALLAGSSWGVAIILVLAFGESALEEPGNASATVLGLVGSLGLAAAAVGLIWRFQDQVGPIGSLGGMLVAIGTILETLGGYTAFAVVPIGSAMLAWDLGRAGILSRPLSIALLLSSAAFSVTVIRILTDYAEAYRSWVPIAFTVPYVLTWIAIGAFLMRGVPRAHESATGV